MSTKGLIEQLIQLQKNKPKQEEENKWAYTTREGGLWKSFDYPVSESAIKRIENELLKELNWGRYKGSHPEGGDRNYTMVRTIPPFSYIRIHSLKFPDGRIWDSSIRTFRYE